MGFVTSSDPIVELAFWTGIAVLILVILMVLYVLFLRYKLFREERRKKRLVEIWRPLLIGSLDAIPENLPPVGRKDWTALFNLWSHFHEALKGQAKESLNEVARRIGMPGMALRLLQRRNARDRLAAIVVLGFLRDKSAWEDIKKVAMEETSYVSMAAVQAMVRIDEEGAVPFIMPLIGSRSDWPVARVAGILLEARPEVVCPALGHAVLHFPKNQVPRLVRYLGVMACDSSTAVLRQVMEKYPTEPVIAACLQSLKSPDALDLVRKHLTHAAWHVRVQAARALGRMGLIHDKYILVNMLSDTQWWVRYRAAQALANLPYVSMDDLEKIKQEHPDRYARDILAQVIAEKRMP
ncbi:MAG: HEAT repeat domain-containing protein [Gammaproteobacteria bacterium]|nr:HEAT repeat domain-containing protein [Gammaproteobacteria bacterium]